MQTEFERFPFSISGLDPESSGAIIGDNTFIQTKRVEKIIPKVEEDLPPPPPTFSEQDLQAAKEEAYRRGFNDGERKGKAWADSEIAKTEQAALELTPKIIEHVAELFERYNQFTTEQKEASIQLSLAIAKKMTAGLPDEYFFEQVAQHTIECTEKMLGEPQIHIYVHPTLSDKMEQRLAKHFAGSHEPGDVIIHAEETLQQLDCRIEWTSGGMEYKHGTVQAELEEIVRGLSPNITAPIIEEATLAAPVAADVATTPAEPSETLAEATKAAASTPTEEASTPSEAAEPVDQAVASAIAGQLANDDIPPIPELPSESDAPTTASSSLGSDTNNQSTNTANPTEGESNE